MGKFVLQTVTMKTIALITSVLGLTSAASVASISNDVRPDFVIEIEPDFGPDWGEWNGGAWCPEDQYAHGFKQKTDSGCSGGGECTGLNAIEMFCGFVGEDSYIGSIKEYEGPFGEWYEEHLCAPKGFLKQGQQNFQSYQGVWVEDNVWTSFVACPGESVICGFETKGSTAFPDN